MSLVYNRARSSSLAMLALSAIAGVAGCGGRDDDGDDDDERPAVASASDSSTPAAVGAANRAPAGNTVAEGSRGAVAQSGTTWSFDGARAWARVDDGPKGTMHHLASVNVSTGMGGIFLYAVTDQGLVRGPD